ncbi:ribosomal L1 domain-containing protein 1 [Octopus bimaculoides]|uniref:Ribosomal L1 domain-containing protein 1 n=1 Tax=Octopus bimaculoides TaxID=37653 RepID=A0A0L8HK84_OCTBM|nr:ribosomal L1 domain-containing protein 1 [Octopus bimaculoides]|eukprot:XP_014771661.1 PREDICTED: ribosomal L1 domain-containing protein 1-like [Octopus bimaculoides]
MASKLLDIEVDQVKSSVNALFSFLKKKRKNELFDVPVKILMSFTFRSIPKIKNKVINLNVPHGLGFENQYICLFVPDLNKRVRDSDPTVFHYKELLAEKDITCISEVITLKTLYLEYRPFEAKRKLCNKFDVFLADKSVFGPLPRILGRDFFRRKRIPIKVDLKSNKLKEEINSAVNDSFLVITGRGSCCMAHIANSTMTQTEVSDNIIAAVNSLCQSIPGGAENIRNIYLKTEDSPSLPVYLAALGNADIDPEQALTQTEPEPEEITWKLRSDAYVDDDKEIILCNNDKKRKLLWGNEDFSNAPFKKRTKEKKQKATVTTSKRKILKKKKAREIWKKIKSTKQNKKNVT